VLSFVVVGIYWNNHHHLLHAVAHVNGSILWANMHLLFWLSLFPVTTGWMGENHFERLPSALYGMVLLLAAIAYWVLQRTIIAAQGTASLVKRAVGRDWKGTLSPVLYAVGIVASLWIKWAGPAIYALVALIWFIPDRRISRELERSEH